VVSAGVGIRFAPVGLQYPVLTAPDSVLRLIAVEGVRLGRHIYLILPSVGETSPAARRFADQLRGIGPIVRWTPSVTGAAQATSAATEARLYRDFHADHGRDPASQYGQDEGAGMPLRKIRHPVGACTAAGEDAAVPGGGSGGDAGERCGRIADKRRWPGRSVVHSF
jgi:hypothetical protein